MDDVPRNPDGTLKPGAILNPDGVTGARSSYVPWKTRIDQLDTKYDTVEKIMRLFVADPQTGKMSPGPDLLAMHPRDAALIMQSLGAIVGEDKLRERETYWDREEGKAIQRNEFAGPGGKELFRGDAATARQTLEGRAIPLLTGSSEEGEDKPSDGQAGPGPSI